MTRSPPRRSDATRPHGARAAGAPARARATRRQGLAWTGRRWLGALTLALGLLALPALVVVLAWIRPDGPGLPTPDHQPELWRAGALVLAALALIGAVVAGRLRQHVGAADESLALAVALFERAGDAIFVLDDRGAIRAANPAATRLLGQPARQLKGQPLAAFLADRPADAVLPDDAELTLRRPDGGTSPCRLTLCALPAAAGGGPARQVATLQDLSERHAAERRMRRMATHDSLTGLPNRSLFRDRLGQALHRAERHRGRVALMFLDLDRFKHVNDSLGHGAGDRLLQHVAATLTAALRGTDSVARVEHADDDPFTVARLGGDEFTVIVEDLHARDEARAVAERLQTALQRPFTIGGHEIVVTTSIGITVFPDDPCPPDDLLKHADLAMYRAKDLGRNAVAFYSAEMDEHAQRRLRLEAELRRALERDEFVLEFQPKADIERRRITGVEALLRWQRDGAVVAPPEHFIPVLEETGLIQPVGRWVLEQAARQVVAWRHAGLPWLAVAINLSASQLRQRDLAATVRAVIDASGLPSAKLELELTESMLMDGDAVADTLRSLSALGLQLAVDDFGTGYSSLSYLKRFNLDALKIDRRFVQDMPNDPDDSAIASAVIALARSLKLRVVAEGVETEAQQCSLAALGCDEFQGYLLSPPLPAADFERWWRDWMATHAPVPDGR